MSGGRPAIDWDRVRARLEQNRDALQLALYGDRATLEAAFRRRARQLARRETAACAADTVPVLAFWLAGEGYGIELEALARIVPACGRTRIPGAPAELWGVVNVSGEIRPVLDLQHILGLPAAAQADAAGYILLLRRGGREVGIHVHRIDGVRPVGKAELAARAGAQAMGADRFIKSCCPGPLAVLDAEAIRSHPVFGKENP